MRQALSEYMALERGLLIREQVVDVTRRDSERRGGGCKRKIGIGEMGTDMRLDPIEQRGTMGRRRQWLAAQPFAQGHRDQVHRLLGQPDRMLRFDLIGALAKLIDEIMRKLLHGAIG